MSSPCREQPAYKPVHGPVAKVVAKRLAYLADFNPAAFDKNRNVDFGEHAGPRRDAIKGLEQVAPDGSLSAKRDHPQRLAAFSFYALLEQIDKPRNLIQRDVVILTRHDLR